MTIYIIPANGDASSVTEATSRATIAYFHAATVREFILGVEGLPIAVVSVPEEVLLVLTRHASQFFVELPSVLTSVPGIMYDQGWMTMGTVLPPTHWKTFEEQTKRSGVLATTPEKAESRGVGANVATLSPDDDDVDGDLVNSSMVDA